MSQENVEIAKRAMDGYNTRDLDYELIAPDFEWITAMAGVENEVMRGREGVEKYYERLDAVWEYVRVFGGECRDLGDSVLWLGQMEGRGRVAALWLLASRVSLRVARRQDFAPSQLP